MMKKKGFTLVELLAVIAILAILVIIALPNIMSLFNQAKQNSFENELKQIFKEAEQEWMKDSMFDTESIVYARNKSEKCTKELSLSGREEIEYYIEVDKAGNVIKYFATDGTYQYEYNGLGLKIEEIGDSKQVAALQSKDVLTVTCDGASKNGRDVTNGEVVVDGSNIGEDCSGNEVTNTIPSNATGLYKIMAEQAYLDNAKSEFVTRCEGVDFSKSSSDTNGKSVYEIASTKDDTYPIYYYRGAVTNNNVKFGGFCWKAVRTTNTGGVKLIYNGRPNASGHCTKTTGTSTYARVSTFNYDYYHRSPAYVGYMYGTIDGSSTGKPYKSLEKEVTASDAYKAGTSVTYSGGIYTLTNTSDTIDNNHHYTCFNTSTTCSTVYYVYYKNRSTYYYITITGVNPNGRELIEVVKESMFRNDRDSDAKRGIENWYENNMTSLTDKLEDTIYCNDRSISNQGGWSTTGEMISSLSFSGYTRTYNTHKPSLICERQDDTFTVSSSLGNGELKYPVGLLTVDEIMLAGGGNSTFYLYTNETYWSGSPGRFDPNGASEFGVYESGWFITGSLSIGYGLRPVVSISKNTSVTSGDGTANNPYVID